jgi:hypothetical protein
MVQQHIRESDVFLNKYMSYCSYILSCAMLHSSTFTADTHTVEAGNPSDVLLQ